MFPTLKRELDLLFFGLPILHGAISQNNISAVKRIGELDSLFFGLPILHGATSHRAEIGRWNKTKIHVNAKFNP
jgi:hypothetical protein